ncbi:translation initiation factor IF-2-like [Falco biarmicus]|uniref:translation initiation factor IF-2-like n=1 Tax=Falco biarmicus TaxID=345155 RepID=UPI0024BCBC73|nr:translation initiation factor IF-2-like [Falco biarmicus]
MHAEGQAARWVQAGVTSDGGGSGQQWGAPGAHVGPAAVAGPGRGPGLGLPRSAPSRPAPGHSPPPPSPAPPGPPPVSRRRPHSGPGTAEGGREQANGGRPGNVARPRRGGSAAAAAAAGRCAAAETERGGVGAGSRPPPARRRPRPALSGAPAPEHAGPPAEDAARRRSLQFICCCLTAPSARCSLRRWMRQPPRPARPQPPRWPPCREQLRSSAAGKTKTKTKQNKNQKPNQNPTPPSRPGLERRPTNMQHPPRLVSR